MIASYISHFDDLASRGGILMAIVVSSIEQKKGMLANADSVDLVAFLDVIHDSLILGGHDLAKDSVLVI
jgi:hypothetical protein